MCWKVQQWQVSSTKNEFNLSTTKNYTILCCKLFTQYETDDVCWICSLVVSMQDGGALWFVDLTAADPFYLLPVITRYHPLGPETFHYFYCETNLDCFWTNKMMIWHYSQTWSNDHLRIATTRSLQHHFVVPFGTFIIIMTSEQRPRVNNGHYFWVPRVIVVLRFDCTQKISSESNIAQTTFQWDLWKLGSQKEGKFSYQL